MAFEYALVHAKYTIPVAVLLTILCRPFFNRLDVYKVTFLVSIAAISTVPWDSYLIRQNIWTYPPSVVIGPTLYDIPAEEVFFFFIQTYNTSFLYLLLSKPLLHSAYLSQQKEIAFSKRLGQVIFALCTIVGAYLVRASGEGTYLGLILVWVGPFALLLWTISAQFLINLPYTSTFVPIAIPTFYLWIVDTLALRRGTWAIESGTKLGIHLWDGLEIEEAVFFLATNTLIVFGLVAFDYAMTILLTFPRLFPIVPALPSPILLLRALLVQLTEQDFERVKGIRQASERLRKKSRSFYLAGATFFGRLRIDMVLLYSFCRVADDLVDDSSTEAESREWIEKIMHYLDLAYATKQSQSLSEELDFQSYIAGNFPASTRSAFSLLPTRILPYGPLYDLLEGFKTDLEFHDKKSSEKLTSFPIATEHDLEIYAARVAGTIAELCLELVFRHSHSTIEPSHKEKLVLSGGHMGIALQYVNIARDIATDAAMGRVYLPTSWLEREHLKPQDVLETPHGPIIDKLREKLLIKAFAVYEEAIPAIMQLPRDARAPMRVAVESYMEIGRVLRERGYRVKAGKATVPKLRRLKVAWRALNEG